MQNRKMDAAKPLLLVFPFEQLAHYLRCLTLAKKAAPYFEIRFAHSDKYLRFVEQEGFETFSCNSIDVEEVQDCVKRFDFSWINKTNLEHAFNGQVAALEKWKPALVLGEAVPTLKIAAEKTGVPYISLMNGYMTQHYGGMRRMSWRYPLFKYLKFLPEGILDDMTKKGERLTFYKIHQPFKELRQQHGLSKKLYYTDELEGDLNLLCDLPELFPQQHLPQHYRFIPPLIYQPATESDGLLKKLDPHKQTLFVSMGSTGDWEGVAFLNKPVFQKYNIVTAGDATGVVQAPQVIRAAFANPEPLFRQVDLVLCHGGNGTIYQALCYGIPLLCKTAHFEQEWNVQALEKAGLGASLDAVKNESGYLKIIDAWITKKNSPPHQFIRQKITEAGKGFGPVIARILALAFPTETTIYYEPEKESA